MPSIGSRTNVNEKRNIQSAEEAYLFPASMPPKYTIFDLFPFSLLIKIFAKRGHEVKGKKAARIRAKMMQKTVSHNLPLEISLYLVSLRKFSSISCPLPDLASRARILRVCKVARPVMFRLRVRISSNLSR